MAMTWILVAPTGFEPATSALRGRRPKPLDDGAMMLQLLEAGYYYTLFTEPNKAIFTFSDIALLVNLLRVTLIRV